MKNRRFLRREVVWMLFPVLVLLAGGWYLNRRDAEKPRRDSSGPLRLEIVRIVKKPLTRLDAKRGFSFRLLIEAQVAGQPDLKGRPVKVAKWKFSQAWPKGKIVGQQAGKTISLPGQQTRIEFKPPWGGDDFYEESTGLLQIPVLIAFPRAAGAQGDLKLEGKIDGTQNFDLETLKNPSRQFWASQTCRSAPFSFVFHQKGAPWPMPPPTTTPKNPLALVDIRRQSLPPVISNKMGLENSSVNFVFDGWNRLDETQKREGIRAYDLRIENRNGHPVDQNAYYLSRPQFRALQHPDDANSNEFFYSIQLSLNKPVPLEPGPYRLRGWLALDDDWPIEINTPVRNPALARAARKIQILEIRFVPQRPENTAPYVRTAANFYFDTIQVRVRYTGGQTLKLESRPGEYFDSDPFLDKVAPARPASTDYLITQWSEHLENARGKAIWRWKNKWIDLPAIEIQQVRFLKKNEVLVVYRLESEWRAHKKSGLVFKAQIGVEDDGFLPVELALP